MPPRASIATERVCSDCKLKKPVSEFHGKGTAWDGTLKYQSYCRKCANKRRAKRNPPFAENLVMQKSAKKYRENNRELLAKRTADRRALDPQTFKEYEADRHLKANYGLTREQWWDLLRAQDFRCYGCPKILDPEKHFSSGRGKKDKICVDHDHLCCPGSKSCGGCIRGLLCDDCNRGAGSCKDDPEILERLAVHIRRFRDGYFASEHTA